MRDVIEVEVRLGDTLLETAHVSSRLQIEDIELDAATLALRRGARSVPVTGAWLRERVGLIEVAVRRVEPPRRHALVPSHVDRRSLHYIAASLAVHLVVWALAAEQPPEATVTIESPKPIGTRVVGAFPSAATDPILDDGDSPDLERDGGGQPTMGLEGAAGGASTRDRGHARLIRRDRPAVTREAAIESARAAGILGSSSLQGQGFAALVGSADPASGFDSVDAQGPLYGGSGDAGGTFGLGRSGFGGSAGCTGGDCNGIIGVSRYGTISNGRSAGDNWGGAGIGAPGGRQAQLPTVHLCAGPLPCYVSVGGLDKNVIRRHVRRHLPKIQYCYEKELLASPGLDGTVETKFLIAVDGKVMGAEAKGVSETVSSCVAGVIQNIEFPRSPDGATEVHYPFTFRRTGS